MIIRMLCKITIGLLVALLSVYLGFCIHKQYIQCQIDSMTETVMAELERWQKRLEGNFADDSCEMTVTGDNGVKKNEAGRIDEQHIQNLVREVIKNFDVDRTGMTDFAMAALGGQVLSTPETKTYGEDEGWESQHKRGPSTILEPSALPGDCWAFAGKKGTVVIRLFAKIVVTNVTLEHISRDLSPTGITSAPSIFSMVGVDDPESTTGHNYGTFVYRENRPALQTFPVRFTFVQPFEIIRVHFQDNHGNEDFTCVYRIRIHGRRSDKPIRTDRLPDLEET